MTNPDDGLNSNHYFAKPAGRGASCISVWTPKPAGSWLASLLTGHAVDGGSQIGPLLDQVPGTVTAVLADGADDRQDVYGAVNERQPKARVVVPPRATAVPSATVNTDPTQRDRHLQDIALHERMTWQKTTGYTPRALVEAAISRFKHVIGGHLRFHNEAAQETEIAQNTSQPRTSTVVLADPTRARNVTAHPLAAG